MIRGGIAQNLSSTMQDEGLRPWMSKCQKGKEYMNNEKETKRSKRYLHPFLLHKHVTAFVAIHQTMGWVNHNAHPVWEKNTCMRLLSKCIIFATLAKYSNVRCNEVSTSRAFSPLEFLFSLSAVRAIHPAVPPFLILPFSFSNRLRPN